MRMASEPLADLPTVRAGHDTKIETGLRSVPGLAFSTCACVMAWRSIICCALARKASRSASNSVPSALASSPCTLRMMSEVAVLSVAVIWSVLRVMVSVDVGGATCACAAWA